MKAQFEKIWGLALIKNLKSHTKPHDHLLPLRNQNIKRCKFLVKHFSLVHGVCHRAWILYKLNPWLESVEGNRVTAVDLSAFGINTRSIREIHTFEDYAELLMELMVAIPVDEKGHFENEDLSDHQVN